MLIGQWISIRKTNSIFYRLESYSTIQLLNNWDLESRDMLIIFNSYFYLRFLYIKPSFNS